MSRYCVCMLLSAIFAALSPLAAGADWPANGLPLCLDPSYQYAETLVPDGAGGAFCLWRDLRGGPSAYYAQHVDAGGNALWEQDGRRISSPKTSWSNIYAVPDGAGGFIVSWVKRSFPVASQANAGATIDGRPIAIPDGIVAFLPPAELASTLAETGNVSSALDPDSLYIQRFDAAGAPLWGDPGVLMPGVPSPANFYQVSDGAGGAILVWADRRSGTHDIYAQRISASGAALWSPGGVPVCDDPANQYNARISTDGAGGAIVTWMDNRDGYTHVYVQRIDPLGASLWDDNGKRITTVPGVLRQPILSYVGAGRVIVSWIETNDEAKEIHALKLDGDGNALWPDERFTGVSVPSFTACYSMPDRTGGVVYSLLWPLGSPKSVSLQRVDGEGSLPWGAAGIVIAAPGLHIEMYPVADGSGGAYCAWIDDPADSPDNTIFVQWVRRTGEAMWGDSGMPICAMNGGRWDLRGTSDDAGGAIFQWTDARFKPPDRERYDVFALRVFSEQPVEAALDIRPGSCPNPINPASRGVLPVAILGDERLDVEDIDPASVRLAGVAPVRWSVEDVATPPTDPGECACAEYGPDGRMDLALKFETQAIVAALGDAIQGGTATLTIEGTLENGTRFEGSDCVVVVGRWRAREEHGDARRQLHAKSGPMAAVQEFGLELPEAAFVEATVYDVSGRLVARLRHETMPAGVHTLRWDAGSVSSGMYFLRVAAGSWIETRKMPIYR